jgi:uncharacterized protein
MSTNPATVQPHGQPRTALLAYLLLGVCFGIVLTKSEVVSWFRIQEMFRFQSPRMYEIIASAVVVAAVSVALIKRLGLKTLSGEPIAIPPKRLGRGIRYAVGGTLFGLGWALTGACPGPLFALVGNGVTVMIVAIVSALAGTWLYGLLRPKLPH